MVPAESTEVQLGAVKPAFHHGGVLETIMAKMNGSQGDRITAGLGAPCSLSFPPLFCMMKTGENVVTPPSLTWSMICDVHSYQVLD